MLKIATLKEKLFEVLNLRRKCEQTVPHEKYMDIDSFIEEIENILKIKSPAIKEIACLFESGGKIQAQQEFKKNELPADASFLGGYYLDSQNCIIVARKIPIWDLDGEIHFMNQTLAEKLFTLTHELRHVWQKMYHEDFYYTHNAVGLENINDKSEIDADAFAITYVFSDKTPFTVVDLPNQADEIMRQATADGGKRFVRAKELAVEYSINNGMKIKELQESVDKK